MPGPAPNPHRRRRNAGPATTKLPAEGRRGSLPAWPLPANAALIAKADAAAADVALLEVLVESGEATKSQRSELSRKRERLAVLRATLAAGEREEGRLWAELWTTPQAVAWERLRWTREVAQYVRWKVLAEQGDLDAAKEARQLADRLGLTPLAMLRLRWEIVEDEVAAARLDRSAPPRERNVRAVDDAASSG